MIDSTVIELSRLQFALTALYHFLFVPLTLGLSFLLATIETVYVVTGKSIYKEMALFWSKLFGINFAIGVATGLTMEFEFGTNWSMYSHFVGDVFGLPLALEGLMAFFMESTFLGLMLFGWERLSKPAHLAVTYIVALGSNISALWILVANGFMQDPVGASFNPDTMRMEFQSIGALIFSPDAQAKFVHTSVAGFVSGSMFIMGISAFYLLNNRHRDFAIRSFRIAALFGVFSSLAAVTLGDALGRVDYLAQPTKLAAMEGVWQTTKPPAAAWDVFAIPDDVHQTNYFEFGIPYVLTPLITHSTDKPILGLSELEQQAQQDTVKGIKAVLALRDYAQTQNPASLAVFRQYENSMGYGFLAQRYAPDQDLAKITQADLPAVLDQTARASIPNVFVEFWAFRFMMALGFAFVVVFSLGSYYSLRNELESKRWLLKLASWSIPLPILACEYGWIVAENGRQPWTVYGWLPTFQSASSHSAGYMIFSLIGFALLYSAFIAVELYLMFKYARLGPMPHDDHQSSTLNVPSLFAAKPQGGTHSPNWQ